MVPMNEELLCLVFSMEDWMLYCEMGSRALCADTKTHRPWQADNSHVGRRTLLCSKGHVICAASLCAFCQFEYVGILLCRN